MSARSGSLGWVVLAGTISVVIAGAMWGLLDSVFVDSLTSTDIWDAPIDSVPATSRAYIIQSWDWLLLIVLIRLSVDSIVAARLTGGTTNIPAATMVLLVFHLLMVTWALVFPEVAGGFYAEASSTQAVQDAGYQTAVDLAFEWGIAIIPAVLLLITDVWYLSAPIRKDLLRA